MPKQELILSIDIEANGPSPITNSMLSFAVAAFTLDKHLIGTFSRNLEERPGTSPDPGTVVWWNRSHENREAYAATRKDLVSPEQSVVDLRTWANEFKEFHRLAAAAYPASYDAMWVQSYVCAFLKDEKGDIDNLLGISWLDLKSYVNGAFFPESEFRSVSKKMMPREWFDELPHTHVAEDDAIEQGCTIINVIRKRRGLPPIKGFQDDRR